MLPVGSAFYRWTNTVSVCIRVLPIVLLLCHVWPLSTLPKSCVCGEDFQLSMLPHAPGEDSHLYGISSTNNVSEK